MKKIFLTLALTAGIMASAQVKIGDNVTTLNANSLLELESTSKGVLFPRVTLTGTTDATTVGAHVAGMTVYNTATAGDVTPGMYTNNGAAWVKLGAASTTSGPLYGKTIRTVSAGPIVWASGDISILLLTGYTGNIVLPSASANPNRVVGINNRSGSTRAFDNTAGGDTGLYTNDGVIQLGASVGMVHFVSDGVSWRLYSGRP